MGISFAFTKIQAIGLYKDSSDREVDSIAEIADGG
jgi:hypothetical protein